MSTSTSVTDHYSHWQRNSVNWPFEMAGDLAAMRKIPGWCRDEWIRLAISYLRAKRSGRVGPQDRDVFAAIHKALAIRDAGGLERVFLEARILANESVDEIAEHSSLPPLVVIAYERLLFRISHSRDATDWIVVRAIGRPAAGLRSSGIGQILRRHGYFSGPVALERLIQTVRRLRGESLIADLDFSEGGIHLDAEELAVRKMLVMELLPISSATTVLAAQLAVEQKARSAHQAADAARQSDTAQTDWRASALEFAFMRFEMTTGGNSSDKLGVA